MTVAMCSCILVCTCGEGSPWIGQNFASWMLSATNPHSHNL